MYIRASILVLAVLSTRLVWAADSDARPPGPHPESQALKNPMERNTASIQVGKQVYERMCVTCHGIDGKGVETPAAQLAAPPSDLTDGDWKYGGTDGEIFTIVRDGTKLGMEPFKDKIPDQRLWHVVNFLRDMEEKAKAGVANASSEPVLTNPIEASAASIAKGQHLYRNYCHKCHGADGTGITEYLEFLVTAPADFTKNKLRYGNDDGTMFRIIRDGTPNDMEPFADRMTEDDMWDVVNYVKQFFPK